MQNNPVQPNSSLHGGGSPVYNYMKERQVVWTETGRLASCSAHSWHSRDRGHKSYPVASTHHCCTVPCSILSSVKKGYAFSCSPTTGVDNACSSLTLPSIPHLGKKKIRPTNGYNWPISEIKIKKLAVILSKSSRISF